MSQFCATENLNTLKKSWEKQRIFTTKLQISTFVVICEILWNIFKNSKCRQCFSKGLIKQLKKHKKTVKVFFNKKLSLKKRKKRFLKSSLEFKELVTILLDEFFKNCVEEV